MTIIKRAFLSRIRSKGQTVILLLLITVVLLFRFFSVWMRENVSELKKELTATAENIIEIYGNSPDAADDLERELSSISSLSDVERILYWGAVHAPVQCYTVLSDIIDVQYWYGAQSISQIKDFRNGNVKLTEGVYPDEHSSGILLHEDMAERYNLKVGDVIYVEKSGRTYELNICGMYSCGGEVSDDRIYLDWSSYNMLFLPEEQSNTADIHIDSVENIDYVTEMLKEAVGDQYVISTATDIDYITAQTVSALISNTANTMILVGNILGNIIIIIMICLWLKGKMREMAIYLALGERKINIILQFMWEILLVSVIGICTAYFIGAKLCRRLLYILAQGKWVFSDTLMELYDMFSGPLPVYTAKFFGSFLLSAAVVPICSIVLICIWLLSYPPRKILI